MTPRVLLAAVSALLVIVTTEAFSVLKMSETAMSTKHKLYDVPVSNNGARVRLILYKKRIDQAEVQITSPVDLGGLKSPEYLQCNPQGKMPTMSILKDAGGDCLLNVPESDTICRYLISEYSNVGPSFQPDNPQSNLIARLHDMYLTTIQGCLYKASPPFGIYGTRKDALAEFRKQLTVIDDLIDEKRQGIYLCGDEVSLADVTLFPTMIFAKYMLPKFDVPEEEALPPKIMKWYNDVIPNDPAFKKVHDEVLGALQGWDEKGRWDTIWLAGLRDEEPATIFDKIVAGEAPATVVKEDDNIIAFKSIAPAAPVHILVIPKDRSGLTDLRKSSPEHIELLGRLMVAAGEVANDKSLGFGDGARIVVNEGKDGGQEIKHLHIHVLGGRQLQWPPG